VSQTATVSTIQAFDEGKGSKPFRPNYHSVARANYHKVPYSAYRLNHEVAYLLLQMGAEVGKEHFLDVGGVGTPFSHLIDLVKQGICGIFAQLFSPMATKHPGYCTQIPLRSVNHRQHLSRSRFAPHDAHVSKLPVEADWSTTCRKKSLFVDRCRWSME
jgi:hypothetical protein